MIRNANWLQLIFFAVVVKPLMAIVFGLNIRRRELLPLKGPAIIVANHNSHLDAMVLMSMFPLLSLNAVRPAAAMDYFLRYKWLAWFSQTIMGIIPIDRAGREKGKDPIAALEKALANDDILLIFPEGSRGEPEVMTTFKKGVAHLVERRPEAAVVPVFMHGLGMSLPRGAAIPVPLFLDVFVGPPLTWQGDRDAFMRSLLEQMDELRDEGGFAEYE
ncbi:MAG: lysophospholipid acyltransferase family protein [Gammaproteobacteria bacterium]